MNQKGSSSVFLVMILAGMITVTMAFISVSKRVASIACSDDLMHLAGRSVLSEYDPGLKQAYGLFAFRGQQNDIAKGMATYLNTALEHRDDMELSELRADASEYALMNTDRFEKEILKYNRFAIARNLIRSRDTLSGGSEGKLVCKEKSDRILRNQSVIRSLPSGISAALPPIHATRSEICSHDGSHADQPAGDRGPDLFIPGASVRISDLECD